VENTKISRKTVVLCGRAKSNPRPTFDPNATIFRYFEIGGDKNIFGVKLDRRKSVSEKGLFCHARRLLSGIQSYHWRLS
jgi:hypothetical protein